MSIPLMMMKRMMLVMTIERMKKMTMTMFTLSGPSVLDHVGFA